MTGRVKQFYAIWQYYLGSKPAFTFLLELHLLARRLPPMSPQITCPEHQWVYHVKWCDLSSFLQTSYDGSSLSSWSMLCSATWYISRDLFFTFSYMVYSLSAHPTTHYITLVLCQNVGMPSKQKISPRMGWEILITWWQGALNYLSAKYKSQHNWRTKLLNFPSDYADLQ